VTDVPERELDRFMRTVDKAGCLARLGRLVEGHAELVCALCRAEGLEREEQPWAPELTSLYRRSLDCYCETYGARID